MFWNRSEHLTRATSDWHAFVIDMIGRDLRINLLEVARCEVAGSGMRTDPMATDLAAACQCYLTFEDDIM